MEEPTTLHTPATESVEPVEPPASVEEGFSAAEPPVEGGWPDPVYAHVPLIHGADGAKLSKRHGALGVDAYRDELGVLPEALNNYLLRLGWSHGDQEIFTLEEMKTLFDIVSTSSGSCWAVNNYLPVAGPVPASPANRDFAPGFTAENMLKDLKLAQQAALSSGASTPMGAEAAQLFNLFVNTGNGGKDFSGIISNYESDVFTPLFRRLEELSGKKYASTLPAPGSSGANEQEKVDVAFRVIADHIRTLSFAIADGIQPGNTDRNYVLRRILRRAVRYGRTLGFHEPFFYKLVDVVAENFGDIFPEIRAKKKHVQEVLKVEEESFNKTLDTGTALFEASTSDIESLDVGDSPVNFDVQRSSAGRAGADPIGCFVRRADGSVTKTLAGELAFKLYDTYGFPTDLTGDIVESEGFTIDEAGFDDMDRKILVTIIEKFNGGPVGVEALAAAVQEDKGTLEDVYEPYLIQAGFLDRR